MIDTVREQLYTLKLPGIADNLVFRIEQALKGNMSHIEFLQSILEDEKVRRDKKTYTLRWKYAEINPSKSLENFDFSFQPAIDKQQIVNLCKCDFISEKGKILLIGRPGCGKSHCAAAIGLKALEKGFHVYRIKAKKLVNQLLQTKQTGTQEAYIKKLLKLDFIIIDDFALRQYPEGGSGELQGLLDELDEQVAVAITTNRDFIHWEPFFDDKTIASAFTDRAVHNGTIVRIIGGRSYRTKNYERIDQGEDQVDDDESDDAKEVTDN